MDDLDTFAFKELIVYTALFGDYDNLLDPSKHYLGCRFICFTDQVNLRSEIWEIVFLELNEVSPAMMNRRIKMLPHEYLPKSCVSVYIDSNIRVTRNPVYLIEKYLEGVDLAIPCHFRRDTVFEEALTLLRTGRISAYGVFRQMSEYINHGFRGQVKLGEHNIILRRHDATIEIMEAWWREFCRYPQRDQLCLSYILWICGYSQWMFMEESSRNNLGFSRQTHKKNAPDFFLKKLFRVFIFQIPYFIFMRFKAIPIRWS